MNNFIRIAEVSQCPPGTGVELVAGDRIVALFNVDGEFFAVDGICPHQGGPLGKGKLTNCLVTCPWHGWQFDVRTGKHQASSTLFHTTFETRVDGDEVYVDLSSEK